MTPDVPGVVRRLIDAVSRGQDIDWDNLERNHAKDGADIARLRTLDEYFFYWRKAGASEGTGGRRRMRSWLALLSLLAFLQIILAIGGILVGEGPPRAGSFPAFAILVLCACAIWLLAGRGRDRRPPLLATFFLACGSAASFPFVEQLLLHVPATFQLFLRGVAFVPESFMAVPLWLFVREFPRLVRFGRFERLLSLGVGMSVGGGVVLATANILAVLSRPVAPESTALVGILARSHSGGMYWLYLLTLCSLAIVVAWCRSSDAPRMERRRFRTFLAGLALGVGPLCLDVFLQYLVPAYLSFMSRPDNLRWSTTLLYAVLLTTPLSATYAVVADHLFDVRVIIRRATERKLAGTVLASIGVVPLFGVGLVFYERRHESVAEILGDSSVQSLLVIGAVGLLIASIRRQVLARVRRWAVPRTGTAEEVIAEATRQMLGARSPLDLQRAIASSAAQAFGARADILVAAEGSGNFTPAGPGRSLLPTSCLIPMAHSDAAPQRVSPEDEKSLFRWLPEEDKQWVLDAAAASVVPAFGPGDTLVGFVSFGPRSDESRYSKEDEKLQVAVAGALALAFEAHRARYGPIREDVDQSDVPALVCPKCGIAWVPDAAPSCLCNAEPKPAEVPFLVRGKLRLVRLIGRGGMGVVYEAEDQDLNRRVALKVIPQLSATVSAQLRSEARAMASIEHRNLARVYGLETWRGVAILVLELLAGGNLLARLARPWPVRETLGLGMQIAEALDIVHRAGIVHRDVKPSNIGFTLEGTPKLLDFGLARMVHDVTRADRAVGSLFESTISGTPGYLSPEALQGQPGPAQDLWALSMVLYEAIAGCHPLAGADLENLTQWNRSIPDLRDFRDSCPESVARFLRGALSFDTSERPENARVFSRALAALLEENL